MLKYENRCVGCPSEMGCTSSCPYIKVPVYYCDFCGQEAEYKIDEYDCCENCAEKYLEDLFNSLDIKSRANLVEADISLIDD